MMFGLFSGINFISIVILCSKLAFANPDETPKNVSPFPIDGKWSIYQVIFRGDPREPTHTLLELDLQDGQSRLFWKQIDDEGFCERTGNYRYSYPFLEDEVTWANPKNLIECATDPDMRVGNRSITKADDTDGMLRLYLPLGDDQLIYVFKPRQ